MTEPQPVMAQAEQDQLTRQVGRALLTVAGADWQQVRAEYRAAGRHVEVDVLVKGPDGAERPVRPPQEVVEGLGRLRQGMYRPGRGTWLSALYVLDPPSAFSAEFEPDVEPRWRRVPPQIGFADELRFYPREDDHIPDWLRQRAGLPSAEEAASPTPPGGMPARPGPQPGGPAPHAGGPQGPRPQGAPTPPPGIPATPFSGQGPANPPRQGEPTPPPGIPAGPFTRPGGEPSPPHGFDTPRPEHTPPPGPAQPAGGRPPGIPAGPFVGGGEPARTSPRAEEPGERGWGPPAR